jgi:hypothetical protein
LKMVSISTATWIMVLAPIAAFQALGVLLAVAVGRSGSGKAEVQAPEAVEQRVFEEAA